MRCAVVAGLLLLATLAVRAEPLPPELNLIPRESGAFVSIRVAELWNDARLKPLREFFEKEPTALRDFEIQNGFGPADLERATFLISGFDERRGPSEPCVVLTFVKPLELEKLLDAWKGMTPAEAKESGGGRDGYGPPTSKGSTIPPMQYKKRDFPRPVIDKAKEEFPKFEPKSDAPPAKLDKFRQDEFFIRADREEADPPAKEKRAKRDLKASYYVLQNRGFLIPIDERTVVLCFNGSYNEGGIQGLLAALLRRSDTGSLSGALEAAAGKHMVVAGCNLRSIKDAIPRDGYAEILPFGSILSSRSATLTFDLSDEMKLALRIDAPDAATAKRAHDVLKSLHILGLEMLPGLKKISEREENPAKILFPLFEPLLRDAQFEQKEAVVMMTMTAKVDVATWAVAFSEAIEKTRRAADRARASNNLKQIGIAVHAYHDTMNHFPFPGVAAPKGQPMGGVPSANPNLSWRVAILPYIEQQNLYQQFHFDEPWDSEHNKKLIPMIPKIYVPLGTVPNGQTHLRVFTGPNTFGSARSFTDITDGSSNTIMVVESSERVPWTKPDEFPLDPKNPKAKLGNKNGKLTVVMGDGSVRTIDLSKLTDETLRNAITTNDGNVLGSDW